MKKNYIVIGLALVVGAFFVFYGSNTDLFKGNLTIDLGDGNSETYESEDIHPIDLLKFGYLHEMQSIDTDLYSSEVFTQYANKFNLSVDEMKKIFNLVGFENVKIKKDDNGDYVRCDDPNVDDCFGFESLGISKNDMQRILGLQPYVVPPVLQAIEGSLVEILETRTGLSVESSDSTDFQSVFPEDDNGAKAIQSFESEQELTLDSIINQAETDDTSTLDISVSDDGGSTDITEPLTNGDGF